MLALTFMHGSRRRLDDRLRDLGYAYECTTIDSFAWRVVVRWRSLAEHLGHALPLETDYDAVCAVAAALLEQFDVVGWVAATHPIALVDEAQDLTEERLRIVRALGARLTLLVAADEFQCLDEGLRPNPFCSWITAVADVEILDRPHRTRVADLLSAATALRQGETPMSGRQFVIRAAPSVPLARTFLSNQIGWCRGAGSVAVITPSVGRYATNVLQSVAETPTKQGNGPYSISWDRSEQEVLTTLLGQLELMERASLMAADQAVQRLGAPAIVTAVRAWLGTQQRALGRTEVSRREVEDRISRAVSHSRRFAFRKDDGLLALTVHGAKNREFDGVIVLWPYAVVGSAEQKRRLLYNAVTRAKRWCLVLAEGDRLLGHAPFAA
ncbi:ATP-binding domain-containing protein [Azospirillum argentinense]|uniref:ATP-binding domain-containing protein n=1 Tax=Azospirillum argentinense TaxID=2970906 RepID=UPI003CE5969F